MPQAAERLPWYQRRHASHVHTRYYSAGWEFETAQDARQYVDQQYAKYPLPDRTHTPFQSRVTGNGVETAYFDSRFGSLVRTQTYTIPAGAAVDGIRARVRVASPSDCVWIVPGTED